jgi:hypothetical protein
MQAYRISKHTAGTVGSRQQAGFSKQIDRQMAAPPCDCATQAKHGFRSATGKGTGRRRLIEPARTANSNPPIQEGRIHKGRTPWNGAGHAMEPFYGHKRTLAAERERGAAGTCLGLCSNTWRIEGVCKCRCVCRGNRPDPSSGMPAPTPSMPTYRMMPSHAAAELAHPRHGLHSGFCERKAT